MMLKAGMLGIAAGMFGLRRFFRIEDYLKKKKMKIIAINGSPRRDMNTATLLEQALNGAAESGAKTEMINLYAIKYKGCVSCLTCKLKDSGNGGLCAYRDDLTPILQRCREADALIFGSPIYYDNVNGMMRSFLERLMFPIDPYTVDEETGARKRYLNKVVPTGFIYTMNCPEEMREDYIGHMFRSIEGYVSHIFGSCTPLYSTFTYQFKDYSRYDVNMMREEDKRSWRDRQFPVDKQQARDLGRQLVQQAKQEART